MNTSKGFNAQTGQYVDMISEGIIDPTKVVRTALADAVSVASLMTTTEAVIADACCNRHPQRPDAQFWMQDVLRRSVYSQPSWCFAQGDLCSIFLVSCVLLRIVLSTHLLE